MSSASQLVLVVDDDAAHREMLRTLLVDLGVEVETAPDGNHAVERMTARTPDLVLLDMRMPGLDGLGTLAEMRARGLQPITVVLTAHADLDDAVRAMKLGAVDYLRKPIDVASLEALLDAHLRAAAPAADRALPPLPDGVVIESPLMLDVCRDLARVADSDVPVLLSGETGTGKDVLARLLHGWSSRSDGPLVPVNVAALPEGLVESELFGVVKGAFTGADASRTGRFQEADGGTLFLDEIGELALSLQPKLLRTLQDRRVARVGEGREREVDFRLVSATHRDLEQEIEAGRFRQDLYYRMAVITVEVPPLRERPEDILPLAARCLARAGDGHKRLSPATQAALAAYRWPGNIRELENTMLRAAILAPGDVVLPENLPPAVRESGAGAATAPLVGDDPTSLAEIEKRAILEALERSEGNRSEAARVLGISRRKLLYRLKEYRESSEDSGG